MACIRKGSGTIGKERQDGSTYKYRVASAGRMYKGNGMCTAGEWMANCEGEVQWALNVGGARQREEESVAEVICWINVLMSGSIGGCCDWLICQHGDLCTYISVKIRLYLCAPFLLNNQCLHLYKLPWDLAVGLGHRTGLELPLITWLRATTQATIELTPFKRAIGIKLRGRTLDTAWKDLNGRIGSSGALQHLWQWLGWQHFQKNPVSNSTTVDIPSQP